MELRLISLLDGTGTSTWTLDAASQVTQLVTPQGTQNYTYNDAGQRATMVESGLGTTHTIYDTHGRYSATANRHGENTFLAYDTLGRAWRKFLHNGLYEEYTYDANGNRLTKTLNGVTETYTYDDGDKMLTAGSKSYGYDAAGRTIAVTNGASVTTLSYDWESRLTSLSGATTASYAYNGLDSRVSKIEGGVTNTYVRDGVGVTAPVIRDTFASYTPGTSEKRGATSTFLHSGLKNAETQTSSTSAVTASKSYDAFGNALSTTGIWSGAFGYAGDFGYQEDASGLKLLGHRYYDSTTGRFLTRDPIKDGRNWYVYCGNNPLSFVDPDGMLFKEILGLGGLIVAGVIVGTAGLPVVAAVGAGVVVGLVFGGIGTIGGGGIDSAIGGGSFTGGMESAGKDYYSDPWNYVPEPPISNVLPIKDSVKVADLAASAFLDEGTMDYGIVPIIKGLWDRLVDAMVPVFIENHWY